MFCSFSWIRTSLSSLFLRLASASFFFSVGLVRCFCFLFVVLLFLFFFFSSSGLYESLDRFFLFDMKLHMNSIHNFNVCHMFWISILNIYYRNEYTYVLCVMYLPRDTGFTLTTTKNYSTGSKRFPRTRYLFSVYTKRALHFFFFFFVFLFSIPEFCFFRLCDMNMVQ